MFSYVLRLKYLAGLCISRNTFRCHTAAAASPELESHLQPCTTIRKAIARLIVYKENFPDLQIVTVLVETRFGGIFFICGSAFVFSGSSRGSLEPPEDWKIEFKKCELSRDPTDELDVR